MSCEKLQSTRHGLVALAAEKPPRDGQLAEITWIHYQGTNKSVIARIDVECVVVLSFDRFDGMVNVLRADGTQHNLDWLLLTKNRQFKVLR